MFSLKVSDEGKQALVKLGEGDMRKVLNILQSTALAYTISADPTTTEGNDSTTLTEDHFYLCTGAPLPTDIETIVTWMLTLDITSAFNKIHQLKTMKGIALADILTEVHKYMERIDFPPTVRIYILKELAEIEYRLAIGTSEKLQLGSMVSVFYTARNLVQENMDE